MNGLRVTLVSVIDPTQAVNPASGTSPTAPDPGQRFVGIRFTLVNLTSSAIPINVPGESYVIGTDNTAIRPRHLRRIPMFDFPMGVVASGGPIWLLRLRVT